MVNLQFGKIFMLLGKFCIAVNEKILQNSITIRSHWTRWRDLQNKCKLEAHVHKERDREDHRKQNEERTDDQVQKPTSFCAKRRIRFNPLSPLNFRLLTVQNIVQKVNRTLFFTLLACLLASRKGWKLTFCKLLLLLLPLASSPTDEGTK